MERSTKTLLVLYFFMHVAFSKFSVRDKYDSFPNKKLTNVIKTVMTSSAFHCTIWCSMTEGCLAVNVIGNHGITCELTTGLSNEDEMQDDRLSELFVSNYDKCVEEPGFCLNGATCERTLTSARCLCTDRFQGDQGDGCQECSPRFQGDECQQCAQNYYGDDCDVSFTTHSDKRCSEHNHLHDLTPTDSGNYDDCKEWCFARDDCGGFTVYRGSCTFKTCTDNLVDLSGQTTFLKTVN